LLNGAPGDPIVNLHHLKQPSAEVGPFRVIHHETSGRSTVHHEVDLIELVRASGGLNASRAARAIFDVESPTPAQLEKVRRRLTKLTETGQLYVVESGDKGTKRPTVWMAI
jgi:hypothetical protein